MLKEYITGIQAQFFNLFSEKTVKNWRNNGVISKPKKGGRPSKWVGYEIKYKRNKNYGQ